MKVLCVLGVLCGIAVGSSSIAYGDAWAELTAQRAHFGLPPMVEDSQLSAWAQMKAEWQAARGVGLHSGGNGHEGPNCGVGYTEGTGCLEPAAGWATCAFKSAGSPVAGAGLALGTDGRRYMCLVIRGTNHRDGGRNVALSNTSYLSPDAPVIPTTLSYTREPSYTYYTPKRYPGLDLQDFLASSGDPTWRAKQNEQPGRQQTKTSSLPLMQEPLLSPNITLRSPQQRRPYQRTTQRRLRRLRLFRR